MSESDRIKYDALTRQLERMRAMQYGYTSKFFHLLIISSLVIAGLSLIGSSIAYIIVCFAVVTTGVMASFYLYHVDFARVHARAVEKRLNQLLGEPVLLGAKLEADYFYPPETSKFSGFIFSQAGSFFSVFTLHFCGLWLIALGWSLYNLYYILGTKFSLFLMLYLIWSVANAAYLYRLFVLHEEESRLAATLRDSYELEGK